jgi:tRNA (cytidine/uridine-2'-O-)-methyltransferase
MKKINIVLFNPEIPQNTGNIARTCSVTGASLHIVYPIGFVISDKNLKRAGLDYWSTLDVHYYKTREEFFEKHGDKTIYYFTSKGKHCYTDVEYPDGCFIAFGRETAGIDRDILDSNLENTLRLPMLDNRRCLNLSNSVAIATYEVLRQWDFEDFKIEGILGEK